MCDVVKICRVSRAHHLFDNMVDAHFLRDEGDFAVH